MPRTYELKARAEKQDETRRRIVDAAIELHERLGPLGTTVSDIAERAGVGRVTVYRHFPDEASLLRACSGHYFEHHPFPDLDAWRAIADADERARTGLREAYAYHRDTAPMFRRVIGQAPDDIIAPYHAFWSDAAGAVAGPRPGKKRLAAARLALAFGTWRSLTDDGDLTDAQAVEVALRLLAR
jgi:AcrR family transcriptional regulator